MLPLSKPDYLPRADLQALQLAKLQKLLPYEYERVPLFRRRCDERGVKPRDLVTLADLAKFPFMKKTDLRDEYPLGLTAAPMKEIVRFHCSSGTTGKPICIPNTKGDIEVWADATARCLAMFGLSDEEEAKAKLFSDFMNDDPLPENFRKALAGERTVTGKERRAMPGLLPSCSCTAPPFRGITPILGCTLSLHDSSMIINMLSLSLSDS